MALKARWTYHADPDAFWSRSDDWRVRRNGNKAVNVFDPHGARVGLTLHSPTAAMDWVDRFHPLAVRSS